MRLKSIFLTNFRSWKNNRFNFSPQTTLIVGPNASGKTNILEAIWFLSQGTSFRAEKTDQTINWGQKQAQIKGITVESRKTNKGQEKQFGITLSQEEGRRIKKSFVLNHSLQTRKKFLKNLFAVVFRPEDIRLITGSPAKRRRFLDELLFGVDWQYYQSHRLYQRTLKQRNRLLTLIRERRAQERNLREWNLPLVKNGLIIKQKRQELINFMNSFLTKNSLRSLSPLRLNYQSSEISLSLLEKNKNRDILRGSTGIGPQKDDFRFLNLSFPPEQNDISFWASRGQQRLAILALKLAEKEFLKKLTNGNPIILLDDIFSELDDQCRHLLSEFSFNSQLIATTTHRPKNKFWQKEIELKG